LDGNGISLLITKFDNEAGRFFLLKLNPGRLGADLLWGMAHLGSLRLLCNPHGAGLASLLMPSFNCIQRIIERLLLQALQLCFDGIR
jgi:hypothetical protein